MRIISINNNIPSNNNTKINFGWGKLPEGSTPKLRVYSKEQLPKLEMVAFSNLKSTEDAGKKSLLRQIKNIIKK